MPNIPLSDAQRLDACPFTSDTPLYRLDLTTASASIALGSGGWVLVLEDATVGAIVRIGAAASEPANGASLASAFLVPAGGAATMYLEAAATVHAIMRSGTGRLFAQRVI